MTRTQRCYRSMPIGWSVTLRRSSVPRTCADLVEAYRMEIRITMELYIIVSSAIITNACISHDGCSASHFIGCSGGASSSATIIGCTVKGMVTAKLVAHFMGYIIYIIRISYWGW